MNAMGAAGLGVLVLCAGAPQVFRVEVEGVRVDALVSEGLPVLIGIGAAFGQANAISNAGICESMASAAAR